MTSGTRLSQSVTSSRQIEPYLLQIERNRRHPNRKSKSVTPGPLLAAKMLQIETDRKPPQRGTGTFVVVQQRNRPNKKRRYQAQSTFGDPQTQRERSDGIENRQQPVRTDRGRDSRSESGLNGLAIARHIVLVVLPIVFIVLIVKIVSLVRIVSLKTRGLNY